jgi:hypothetical protein
VAALAVIPLRVDGRGQRLGRCRVLLDRHEGKHHSYYLSGPHAVPLGPALVVRLGNQVYEG